MDIDKILNEVLPGFPNLLNKIDDGSITLKDIGINCSCSSQCQNHDKCKYCKKYTFLIVPIFKYNGTINCKWY